jgi:hypothetical protein
MISFFSGPASAVYSAGSSEAFVLGVVSCSVLGVYLKKYFSFL